MRCLVNTIEPFYNDHLGERRKRAIVERLKQKLMYGLHAQKKKGRCREVAVGGG